MHVLSALGAYDFLPKCNAISDLLVLRIAFGGCLWHVGLLVSHKGHASACSWMWVGGSHCSRTGIGKCSVSCLLAALRVFYFLASQPGQVAYLCVLASAA
jgi:hypothetical protein